MRRVSYRRAVLAIAILLCAGVASAQGLAAAADRQQAPAQAPAPPKPFEPQYGQPGKDVVWVPTTPELVEKMLALGGVTPADFVIDLGSGDGRTVIAAAKRGARAIGIEFDENMIDLSRANAAREGVGDKATFVKADLFETDLSQATVITMFLLTDINMRLRPRLHDLKPGTRIDTNTFKMGDWPEDGRATVDGVCTSWCTAFLWVVPAKVGGTWQTADGSLTLAQTFQSVTGTHVAGSTTTPVTDGVIRGDEVSFSVGDARYVATVSGDRMSGTVRTGTVTAFWSAARTGS